jgi:hypothetical protein
MIFRQEDNSHHDCSSQQAIGQYGKLINSYYFYFGAGPRLRVQSFPSRARQPINPCEFVLQGALRLFPLALEQAASYQMNLILSAHLVASDAISPQVPSRSQELRSVRLVGFAPRSKPAQQQTGPQFTPLPCLSCFATSYVFGH